MEQNNTNIPFKSFHFDYQIQRIDIRENVEVEKKQDAWVNWGNVNNDYPQFLLQIKEESPVLSVCIDGKVNMSYGDGVELEGMGNVMVNRYETLSELYYKVLYDYWIFGGYALEAIPTRDGEAYQSYYHMPFQDIRVGKRDEDQHERETEHFYYSREWQKRYGHKNITRFCGLDLAKKNDGRQLWYWKNYVPSSNDYYPITPYQSGINAAVLEAEIFDFHKRNLATSLLPNLNISLIGDPTPTEKQEIYNELLASYQGKNGQKIMLSFSQSPEERPIIEPISNSINDGVYLEVLNMAIQSIITSNQVSSPLLIGINSFGSNAFSQNANEIKVAYEHMMEVVIKPAIEKINMSLESVLSLKYNQPVKIINKFRTLNIVE